MNTNDEQNDVPQKQQTLEMARPAYFEAKEGERNVEGDMVERNPELHPRDKEGRLTGRKR